MNGSTQIYNRFKGYTVEDCSCKYCLHYVRANVPCPLEVCCCEEERKEAVERELAEKEKHAKRYKR